MQLIAPISVCFWHQAYIEWATGMSAIDPKRTLRGLKDRFPVTARASRAVLSGRPLDVTKRPTSLPRLRSVAACSGPAQAPGSTGLADSAVSRSRLKANGLRHPVHFYQHNCSGDGRLLIDGRNRMEALERIGLPPKAAFVSALSMSVLCQ